MRLSELQHKDVVNTKDGTKIGNIIDVEIMSDGKMNSLIVNLYYHVLLLKEKFK